jgi:nitrite reductase (NO-forming)
MRLTAAALALLAVMLLAGCGSPSQPSGSTKVTMTEFKFDPSTISAPSGKVVFFLVNSGTASHDMIIRDSSGNRVSGAASELVSAGDSFVFTVSNLPAGTYSFFCDQPGHEASGMKGTLTVT